MLRSDHKRHFYATHLRAAEAVFVTAETYEQGVPQLAADA